MPVSDWDTTWDLETDAGNLTLFTLSNPADGFKPVADRCEIGAELRLNTENIPQGHGSLLHRRWKRGMVLRYTAEILDSGGVSLGTARRADIDNLAKLLDNMVENDGRLIWAVPGLGDRMLDNIRLVAYDPPTGSVLKTVSFVVESPFPYAMTEAQQVIATITTSTVVTNNGNTPTYPVWQVNGAFTSFTLSNTTTGLSIVYDSTLPGASAVGGGDYVEIDTFRQTVYLNGNGANRKAGINLIQTDFFPLEPGANTITITGATVDPLVNDAWI